MSDTITIKILTKEGWFETDPDAIYVPDLSCCDCGAPAVELYNIGGNACWALCAGDLEEVKAENCAAKQQEAQEGDGW